MDAVGVFGLVCVAAAITGGGLKALGVEVPGIASLTRQALLACFGIILIIFGIAAPQKANGSAGSAAAPAQQTVEYKDVSVDGQVFTVPYTERGGKMYVALAFQGVLNESTDDMLNAITKNGVSVNIDQTADRAVVTSPGCDIKFDIGQNVVYVNGDPKASFGPAMHYGDYIIAPLQSIAECLGGTVQDNGATIQINT